MAIPPRVSTEIVGETSRLMLQAKLDKKYKDVLIYIVKQGEEIGNRHASKHAPNFAATVLREFRDYHPPPDMSISE